MKGAEMDEQRAREFALQTLATKAVTEMCSLEDIFSLMSRHAASEVDRATKELQAERNLYSMAFHEIFVDHHSDDATFQQAKRDYLAQVAVENDFVAEVAAKVISEHFGELPTAYDEMKARAEAAETALAEAQKDVVRLESKYTAACKAVQACMDFIEKAASSLPKEWVEAKSAIDAAVAESPKESL